MHQDYGPGVHYITYPWSNERRTLRTLSEHLYSPVRLPLRRIDVLNTLMAPIANPTWSLVIHMKTMHAYTAPEALAPAARAYRRMNYPRSARLADAIIINSESLRCGDRALSRRRPPQAQAHLRGGRPRPVQAGRGGPGAVHVAKYGVTKPFVLFVSSLWRYKNCDGLLRAWVTAREQLRGRQLVSSATVATRSTPPSCVSWPKSSASREDVVFVGGVPLEETPLFYQAAELLVYPSFNETFGLPILEAMACGCPVVTSNVSAMPEIAGGAALLCDPKDPASIARAIVDAAGPHTDRLRHLGLRRAGQFTWGATASATLDVYREVADRRRHRSR